MKKLFKSRKALGPVVAAIILITVAVASSIAVSVWTGALTFTFTKWEELKILSHTWISAGAAGGTTGIYLRVRNTGASSLTLSGAEVNNAAPSTQNATGSLAANAEAVVIIIPSGGFTSGQKYEFAILTLAGNRYPYTATAPRL